MKFKFLVILAVFFSTALDTFAQNSVGIGTETPNTKAVLELIAISGNQGFLAPRLTTSQRTTFAASLTAADNGMLVFDSDEGKFYVWFNSAWNPVGVSQLVAGAGIAVNGLQITNTGDTDATDDVTVTTAAAGDVLGRYDSLVVSRLKGLPLDTIAPTAGFSLVWNGSLWKFALDSASNQAVVPNANLLATNTQAALEELQVEILAIPTGPNSVGSSQITDGAITNADINASAAIAGTKVSPNFGAQNITTTGAVTATSFSGDGSGLTNIPATPGPNTVGAPELIDGSISNADVNATAAIAGTKISPNFGAQNIITTGSVTAATFTGDGSGLTNIPATPGANTVGSPEVIDGSIAFADVNTAIVDGVTLASNGSSFEVRDNGISTVKLANGSVTDAKIADVAPAKLTQSGATVGQVLEWSGSSWIPANPSGGLASLTNGTILIGDGTNTPQEQAVSGHITMDNTGTTQIQPGVITHDMVNGGSFIDGVTLASNGTTFEVRDNGITDVKVAAGAAIAGSKINPDFGAQAITTTGTLNADGAVDLSSTGSPTTVNGTLSVAEQATFSFNVDANGGLDVTGGDLTVGGTSFVVSNITGDVTQVGAILGRNIGVDGSSLDALGLLSGVGTGNTDLGVFSGTTISDNTDIKTALQDLETATEAIQSTGVTNQTTVNDLVSLSGVPANSTAFGTFSGTVITDGASIQSALQELETVAEATQSTAGTNQSLINDVISLSGVPASSTAFGSFPGSIISDGASMQLALQQLETVAEATQSTAGTNQSLTNDLISLSGVPGSTTAFASFSGTIISDGSSIQQALQELETVAEATQSTAGTNQSLINDLGTLSGVPLSSTGLGTFSGTIITDATTIQNALQELETVAESTESVAFTNQTAINDLVTLTGLPINSTTLNPFPGSIITDFTDVQSAFQELETAVEANQLIGVSTVLSNGNDAAAGDIVNLGRVGIGNLSPLSDIHINGEGHILTEGGDLIISDNIHTVAGTPTYTAAGAGMVMALSGTGTNFQVFEAPSAGSGPGVTAPLTELMTIQGGVSYVTTDWLANNITVSMGNSLVLGDADNSANISLRAPAVVTASTTFTMPDGDGALGNVLSTNGSGNLVWTTHTPFNTSGEVPRGDGVGLVSSNIFSDGANVGVGNNSPSSRLEVTATGTTAPKLEISDATTGDAGMNFNVSGVNFSMGIDYSDGQNFKISSSNVLGTQDRFRINRTNGETTITTTAGSAPLTLSVPAAGGHYLNVTNGTVNTQYGLVGTSFSAIGTSSAHDMVVWANGTERIRAKSAGGVDVTGALNADDFAFATSVTKYASYSSNVFDILTVTTSDSKFASPNAITGYHYFNGISGALGYAMASVNLPDGAIVTELAGWIWDDDATAPVRVELVRHQHGTSSYNAMATIESLAATALASVQNLTTTSIFFATIDNSQYSYFLRFTGKDDNTQNTRLYNARIEYQLTKPY